MAFREVTLQEVKEVVRLCPAPARPRAASLGLAPVGRNRFPVSASTPPPIPSGEAGWSFSRSPGRAGTSGAQTRPAGQHWRLPVGGGEEEEVLRVPGIRSRPGPGPRASSTADRPSLPRRGPLAENGRDFRSRRRHVAVDYLAPALWTGDRRPRGSSWSFRRPGGMSWPSPSRRRVRIGAGRQSPRADARIIVRVRDGAARKRTPERRAHRAHRRVIAARAGFARRGQGDLALAHGLL
jgi:hypothetical protein